VTTKECKITRDSNTTGEDDHVTYTEISIIDQTVIQPIFTNVLQ